MEASGEDARHHAKEIEHASVSVGDIGPTLSRGSDLPIIRMHYHVRWFLQFIASA